MPAVGRTLIDRELYLPRGWCDDLARREEAGIEADVGFASALTTKVGRVG